MYTFYRPTNIDTTIPTGLRCIFNYSQFSLKVSFSKAFLLLFEFPFMEWKCYFNSTPKYGHINILQIDGGYELESMMPVVLLKSVRIFTFVKLFTWWKTMRSVHAVAQHPSKYMLLRAPEHINSIFKNQKAFVSAVVNWNIYSPNGSKQSAFLYHILNTNVICQQNAFENLNQTLACDSYIFMVLKTRAKL